MHRYMQIHLILLSFSYRQGKYVRSLLTLMHFKVIICNEIHCVSLLIFVQRWLLLVNPDENRDYNIVLFFSLRRSGHIKLITVIIFS